MLPQKNLIDILCNVIEDNNKTVLWQEKSKGEIYENILTKIYRFGTFTDFEGCIIPARFHKPSQMSWSRVYNDARILLLGNIEKSKCIYASFITFYSIIGSFHYQHGIGSFLKYFGINEPIYIVFDQENSEISICNKKKQKYFEAKLNEAKLNEIIKFTEPLHNLILGDLKEIILKNDTDIFNRFIYSSYEKSIDSIENIKENIISNNKDLISEIRLKFEKLEFMNYKSNTNYFQNASELELRQFLTLLHALIYFSSKSNLKYHYYFTSVTPQLQYDTALIPGNLTFSLKNEISKKEIDFFYLFSTILWSNISFSDFQDIAKQTSQRDTFNLLWHNTKHYLNIARKRAWSLENEYRSLVGEDKLPAARLASIRISDVNDLLEMTRYINNVSQYFYDEQGKLRSQPEDVDLYQEVSEFIDGLKFDIINNNADSLRCTTTQSFKLQENISTLFTISPIDPLHNYKIQSYKKVIRVILSDILVNATRFAYDTTIDNNPVVSISFKETSENEITIIVRNECPINEKSWSIWNSENDDIDSSRHNGLGILITKTYLKFFNYTWIIPEKCIKERDGVFTEIRLTFSKVININKHKI